MYTFQQTQIEILKLNQVKANYDLKTIRFIDLSAPKDIE